MHSPADDPAADARALRARPRRPRATSPTSSASGSRPTTSPRRCWSPSGPPRRFLPEAKQARELSVEDLRDVFSVSYEMAAHRFTNLATHHLGLTCHFVKNDESGIIYKAYENDGLVLPADEPGAIEGQRMCRQWSGRQVFSVRRPVLAVLPVHRHADRAPTGASPTSTRARERGFAITLGITVRALPLVPRPGHGTRMTSDCPDGDCCQRPPAELAARWEGMAWPSARAHSHVLSALPHRELPRRGRGRRIRVPGPPRPRVKDWQNGFPGIPSGNTLPRRTRTMACLHAFPGSGSAAQGARSTSRPASSGHR